MAVIRKWVKQMRLIDADELIGCLYKAIDENHKARMVVIDEDLATLIHDAETIEPALVRHARWDAREPMPMYDINGISSWGNWYVCTSCGFATTAIEGHITQYKYCPNCGARMDGEK